LRRLIRLLCTGVMTALVTGAIPLALAAEEPTTVETPAVQAEEKPVESAVYLFLNKPSDLDHLWKSLKEPDFLFLSGEELRRWLELNATPASNRSVSPVGAPLVRSLAIHGTVVGDLANLSLEMVISTPSKDPTWVALRLDNETVTRATERGRDLALRVIPETGWQVRLDGAGDHQIKVDVKVRLRANTESRSLSIGIPESPSTQVDLTLDRIVTDASAGLDEPLNRSVVNQGKGTRLSAHLAPRSRLDLSWRVEVEPGAQLSPLLSIQGDIAIDVDPGTFRARSSWAIRAIRGSMRSLELRLDPEDEVLEVTLDGQSVPAGIERDGAVRLLSIPLSEALRPGPTKRLVLTTKRKLSSQTAGRLSFHGFPLSHAKEQSGAIGIAQSGNLVISPTVGRGLRRIDPRTELPDDLRARPATSLAYQFVDQPFDLDLRIEPSPPLVHCDARTTVNLGAREAKVDTWLDVETANGRLFDLNLVLPKGLELESIGPPEMVESSQVSPVREEGRTVTARLTFRAQEASNFRLHIVGRQAIDPARPVSIALFQPRDSTLGGGRIAVLTERDLTVDIADHGQGPGLTETFRPASQEPPADWPWPDQPKGSAVKDPALWLRYDGSPAGLPLQVTLHPMTVTNESSLNVQIGRRGIEGRQETDFSVQFGSLDQLDLAVPAALVNHWDMDSGSVLSRTDLGPLPDGGRRYRLKLDGEVTGRSRLVFRIHRAIPVELHPEKPTKVEIPWIRMEFGESAPLRARVSLEPGIRITRIPEGWQRVAGDESASSPESLPSQFRLSSTQSERLAPALQLEATALPLTTLPSLVATRLWLRTVQGADHDLTTSAWFWIEEHDSTLSVSIPKEAQLSRARIGGEPVDRLVALPGGSSYRFQVPSKVGSGPVLVALDYVIPAAQVQGGWQAPRLLNGVVQQTRWEVALPSSRAVVGIPSGWTEENQWYWAGASWKRRPWKSTEELASWASGATSRTRGSAGWDEETLGDNQTYLFEHAGAPPLMRPLIVNRGSLVALCSGPVLALGLLAVVYRRSPFRLVGLLLVLFGVAVGVANQPSLTIQILQWSIVGVVFSLLAEALQRMIDRPARRANLFNDPSNHGFTVNGSSMQRPPSEVGSDDSTAIRVRQTSTIDHVTAPQNPSERSGSKDRGSPPQGGTP